MKRAFLVLGFAAALTACEPAIFKPEWVHSEEISPPEVFRKWWGEICECAERETGIKLDREGRFKLIRWLKVAEDDIPCFIAEESARCVGVWKRPHDVYLAGIIFKMMSYGEWTDSYRIHAPRIVEHEMLHDILQIGKHPPVFERCGVGKADRNASVRAFLELGGIMVR